MTAGQQVRFICTSAEHTRAGRDGQGGVLTIEGGKWAYCPWGKTDLHEWMPIEGMDLAKARTTRFAVSDPTAGSEKERDTTTIADR